MEDINNLGNFLSLDAVWLAYPEGGNEGDYCYINGTKYRWNKYKRQWSDPSVEPVTPGEITQNVDGSLSVSNNLNIGGNAQVNGRLTASGGLSTSHGDVDASIAAALASANAGITAESNRAQTAEAQLLALYRTISESQVVPVAAGNWPVSNPQQGVIYRVAGTNSYTDYMYNGTIFVPMATYNNAIDETPTDGSENLVTSGGVANEIALSGVYDVTAHNSGATFASLSALLSDANLSTYIPTAVRKGGMSVKFVQSSDNKYIRYNLLAESFTTDTTQWAIDDSGVYVDNLEFVYVKTDCDDKVLEGTKTDGTKRFSLDVEVGKDMNIEGNINVDGNINGEDITNKVDKISGKSLIDSEFASCQSTIEDTGWLKVETDLDGRILHGRDKQGMSREFVGIESVQLNIDGTEIKNIDDSEGRIEIKADSDGKILSYRDKDGGLHENIGVSSESVKTNKILYKEEDFDYSLYRANTKTPKPWVSDFVEGVWWGDSNYWRVENKNKVIALQPSINSSGQPEPYKDVTAILGAFGNRINFVFTIKFYQSQYFEGGGGKGINSNNGSEITLLKDSTGSYICLKWNYYINWVTGEIGTRTLKQDRLDFDLQPNVEYTIRFKKWVDATPHCTYSVSDNNGNFKEISIDFSDTPEQFDTYCSMWGRFGFAFYNGTGEISKASINIGIYDEPYILTVGHSLCEMNAAAGHRNTSFWGLLDQYMGGEKVAVSGIGGGKWEDFTGTYGRYLDCFPTVKYLLIVNGQNDRTPDTLQLSISAINEAVAEAKKRGVEVIPATLCPEVGNIESGVWENYQKPVNDWIRNQSGLRYVDFCKALTDENGDRIPELYITPDDSHPNAEGSRRLFERCLADIKDWAVLNNN